MCVCAGRSSYTIIILRCFRLGSEKSKSQQEISNHSRVGKSSNVNNVYIAVASIVALVFFGLVFLAQLVKSYCVNNGFNHEHPTNSARNSFEGESSAHFYATIDMNKKGEEIILKGVEDERESNMTDPWQINIGKLRLLNVVGHGEFGLVRKAVLVNDGKLVDVAVKMIKDELNSADLKQEFDVMKSLAGHINVIQLLGCVEKPGLFWVVTEFAENGDLLTFLRKNRGILCRRHNELVGSFSKNLSSSDLYAFAKEIARGMEFLSQNNVVHRDLAARNVLLSRDYTCKVTDFGFARQTNAQEPYMRKSKGKIPVKWTSIEGLLYEIYTSKSDVWSYGVVLYEMFTLGEEPYQNTSTQALIRKLDAGYRMPRPINVSENLYNIMQDCWFTDPEMRPNFIQLELFFERYEKDFQASILPEDVHLPCYANIDEN